MECNKCFNLINEDRQFCEYCGAQQVFTTIKIAKAIGIGVVAYIGSGSILAKLFPSWTLNPQGEQNGAILIAIVLGVVAGWIVWRNDKEQAKP